MLDVSFLSGIDFFKHHSCESGGLRSEQSLFSPLLSSSTCRATGAMKGFGRSSDTFANELE
jgi:hypothetical protein